MGQENKKKERKKGTLLFNLIVFSLITVFSISFLAIMGYMNFKSNYIDIKEQLYKFTVNEMIDKIEASLQFGKELENYSGGDELLLETKNSMGDGFELMMGVLPYVYYSTCDEVPDLSRYSMLEMPVHNVDGEQAGSVLIFYSKDALWEDSILLKGGAFEKSMGNMGEIILDWTGWLLLAALAAICFVIGVMHFSGMPQKGIQHFVVLIILSSILIQSGFSLYHYQKVYRLAIRNGAVNVVERLADTVDSVLETGIAPEEITDLSDYLVEKLDELPLLDNLKLYRSVVNTADQKEGKDTALYISKDLTKEALTLEADLSNSYIKSKIAELVLVLSSTLIIMLMIVFEILRLPGLLVYRRSKAFNLDHPDSYQGITTGLQFCTFLSTMAEYTCLPYTAMMIRDLDQGAFGLSVGVSAALPITAEGIAQMIVIFTLPKVIEKIGAKRLLGISGILMIAGNMAAFFAVSSESLILCRIVAGIAYAGFAQTANHMIANGYDTEKRRSDILARKNAGTLAGITCGAGFGAIIASAFSFRETFLFSSGIFFMYLIAMFCLLPWRLVQQNQKRKESRIRREKTNFRGILRMLGSGELLSYLFFIAVPINIGTVLTVSLIPGIIQSEGLMTIALSYCYIINGVFGIYLAPGLVKLFTHKLGAHMGIACSILIGAFSLLLLELPVPYVVIITASALLGLLDGVGMPLSADQFMELKAVKNTVSEATALVFLSAVIYVLNAVAPMAAEAMAGPAIGGISRYAISAALFVFCAAAAFALAKPGKKKIE